MQKVDNKLSALEKLRKFQYSVAALPFIFGVISLFLALVMIYLESQGISRRFANFFKIESETFGSGTSLLTTLVGAIISVLTFSYSTLIVLLNQATANYSPRVMPKLLAIKGHKIVLGLYVGMIIYNIILILGFDALRRPPVLSVASGILYSVVCIFAFIYFINSVMKEIQPHKIMKDLVQSALENIQYIKKLDKNQENFVKNNEIGEKKIKNGEKYFVYNSTENGYVSFNFKKLQEFGRKAQIQINVLVKNGDLVFVGDKLFESPEKLESWHIQQMMECIMITNQEEDVNYNWYYGLIRLAEITFRGMSPGINDPFTATSGIFYSTILLKETLDLPNSHRFGNIFVQTKSFEEVLNFINLGYLKYAKDDPYCMRAVKFMFHDFLKVANKSQQKIIKNCADKLEIELDFDFQKGEFKKD